MSSHTRLVSAQWGRGHREAASLALCPWITIIQLPQVFSDRHKGRTQPEATQLDDILVSLALVLGSLEAESSSRFIDLF